MKKQAFKQKEELKLDFKKQSLVELNDPQLQEVNGGSSPYCVSLVVSLILGSIYETVKDRK
jgi:hypothetical protein